MPAPRGPHRPEDPGGPPIAPLFLLGPTASGKSEAGILLAESLGASILSLDAMAVYRGMDIATAKPTDAARGRIPHHGVDVAAPGEEFNLRRFLALARSVLSGPRPVLGLVGTPYYLHRLREGLFEGPGTDWELRGKMEQKSTESLRTELEKVDPESAASILATDRRRTVRALEVGILSGKPLSAWKREGTSSGDRTGILLGIRRSREDLVHRIEARVDAMFAAGLLEETRRLQKEGLSRSASQALGTKEVLGHLDGHYDLEEAIDLVKTRTRQFAKRQMTWFRRFPETRWVDAAPGETAESVAKRLLKEVA